MTRASDEARVEARLRAEELGKRIVEEFAIDPDEAMAEYLPGEARLAGLAETDPRRQPSTELRRVATALDRRLTLLGRVNPLALEEFKALEERYSFLSGQLQDLKESRRDLLKVVRAVDERVREVFGQAFEDVAREFQRTFGLLFPGGDGRLVLTEPDDILTSGVEIEARPRARRSGACRCCRGASAAWSPWPSTSPSSGPGPAPSTSSTRSRRRSTTSICTASSTCSTTPASTPSSWSSATSAAPWRPPTPSTGSRCRPKE